MTEQEKFEDVIKQAGKSHLLVKNENGEYLNLAVAAMFEVFESRQPEIDALRKELEQVKMHDVMLIRFVKEIATNFDCDTDAHKYGTFCRQCEAKNTLATTSEQIEAYKQEIIAQAKAEQREADALKCECNFSIEGIAEACAKAIRNNKE